MKLATFTDLMLNQAYISILLNKKMDSCLSYHGLSFTEFVIMEKLHSANGGAMSRISLADAVGLTASGITRLLAPMEKNNIVLKTANPRDARQSLVELSETGQQLFSDALVSVEHGCNTAFSLLDEGETEQLLGLLNKIKC
uniref:Regulatory protein MarR n=1 Tax=uncultured Thiotrichaceae bacterium TaxID=298394 RepID=A0A6S6U3Z7_9GAMM|nr:MAG: Regulatory protein MarR [uncultured Thiotrichaceae bacterium]